ncbi:MAG: phosphate/phosphite/phosphonate ABC transporter substrate-binding protein [Ilumatobacteraceae bacterium]
MTIASLAMYPFPHLQPAYNRLWQAVGRQLPFAVPLLDWDLPADVACRRDDLLVGQTCGWPLITELAPNVRVVGTFDVDVDGAIDGSYRSVLVAASDEPLAAILARPELSVVANSPDSLSGWISLLVVAAEAGVEFDAVEWTGSHAASVDAVRQGRADLASIDAVSWAHLGETGLTVVGHGPRVPCLPLVTSDSRAIEVVDDLRRAFDAAVSSPAMADTCATLRIRGFVSRRLADYEGLSTLAQLG